MLNIYWTFTISKDFALGSSLFGAILDMLFDARGIFSLSDGSGFGKNVIKFAAEMTSFMHINNKKKDIWISRDGLDDTASIVLSFIFVYVCIIVR